MENNKQQHPHIGHNEAHNDKPASQATNTPALQKNTTTSQEKPSSEQTSGGAMPNIQGANQSREAEQNDLR